MKKTALIIALTGIHLCANAEMVRKPYDPKPMVEGNRRVDELIAWNKEHPGELPPLTEQEKEEFFIKEGVPVPGSGARVSERNQFNKLTATQSAAVNQFNKDQKTKGYHEEDSKQAKFLLDMPEIAEKEYSERKNLAYDPYDTHLYDLKSNLKMNYSYKGVPDSIVTKVIGYSPESAFLKEGWSGAVEYFTPEFGGVCAYHEVNIEITKSTTFIPQEVATYLVNDKITTIDSIGSQTSGYVTSVEWWDKKFKRRLECASKTMTPDFRNSVLHIAKVIDTQ